MGGRLGRTLTWGDVRWYRFAHPDKRRPVLVLTRDSALQFLADVTVAPITTRVRGIPTEVEIGPEDGLPKRCAVNLDHVQTVPRSRLETRITGLDTARMEAVRSALLFALGMRT